MRVRTRLVIPTLYCTQCATYVPRRPPLLHVGPCAHTVTTTREPTVTVLRPRWPLLVVVAATTATFLAGLYLAPPLCAQLGISVWISLPLILALGVGVGWYGARTIAIPLEESCNTPSTAR